MIPDWPFADPQNVAVFTSRQIIRGQDWIYYVGHDAEDGAWQFHGKMATSNEADAIVVSLRSIVERDPSIRLLADLPLGWCAWRETMDAVWFRAPQP